jgi:hypothetical protein
MAPGALLHGIRCKATRFPKSPDFQAFANNAQVLPPMLAPA